jgi:putative peptide zinc metalloprotease protein
MGIYMVWPAFYTDVTDAYRLPRRDRLRTDLGGLYFNAIVSVATMGVWLAWHVDALLLLVAVQLVEMVKQLSPVIRADGYHILADATGVPDMYAHIGPTLRRLLPWRRNEPTALKGRARLLVTAWVLIVVPVLLSLAIGAVLLLPRLLTTAWESGSHVLAAIPQDAAHGRVIDVLIALLRLVALVLPLLGSVLLAQRILRGVTTTANDWSAGRPVRRLIVTAAATAAVCGTAWALWPTGQYKPIRADQRGTLASFVTAPAAVAHPSARPAGVHLAPGTHLAVAMIPVGGASKQHPALFVIPGAKDEPAVAILSESAPDPDEASSTPTTTTDPTTTTTTTTDTGATTTTAVPSAAPVQAAAFSFKLPSKPRPGDSQAVAVGTKDGGVTYNVAYSLVTVKDGAAVNNTNSAFAFANCKACTTVAVSFQIVLIIGQSNVIAPVNAAGALNVNCPACITTAIADQIVVTLKSQPSQELVDKLQAALQQLNALPALGAGGTPAALASAVAAVQQQIDHELANSGLLTNPPPATTTSAITPTTTTAAAPTTTTSPAAGGSSTTPVPTTTGSTTTTSSTTTTTGGTATTEASTTTTETTTTTTTTTPSTTTTETTPG